MSGLYVHGLDARSGALAGVAPKEVSKAKNMTAILSSLSTLPEKYLVGVVAKTLKELQPIAESDESPVEVKAAAFYLLQAFKETTGVSFVDLVE